MIGAVKTVTRLDGTGRKLEGPSSKLQSPIVSSVKPQASSSEQQASSPTAEASSFKPQASSSMIREPRYRNSEEVFEDLGPRASAMIKVFSGCLI